MRFLILLFAIFISVMSCKKEQEKKSVHNTESHEATETMVMLNDGKLWKANIETTVGIKTMIKRMDSFTDRDNRASYKILKDSLAVDFNTILQKCTMKGEAHDQLHNYLKPMTNHFDGLESEDLATNKSSFNELEQHLKLYDDYFE